MDIILKYDLLSSFEKKEVNDFIEFLFSKKKPPVKPTNDYKKAILGVSTWSEEDLKVFETNKNSFNEWKSETW